jgi:serine kinase
MKELNNKNVVHRDLKLANILVSETFELKIGDFGFAKFFDGIELLKT